jgi:hypothetical protein
MYHFFKDLYLAPEVHQPLIETINSFPNITTSNMNMLMSSISETEVKKSFI